MPEFQLPHSLLDTCSDVLLQELTSDPWRKDFVTRKYWPPSIADIVLKSALRRGQHASLTVLRRLFANPKNKNQWISPAILSLNMSFQPLWFGDLMDLYGSLLSANISEMRTFGIAVRLFSIYDREQELIMHLAGMLCRVLDRMPVLTTLILRGVSDDNMLMGISESSSAGLLLHLDVSCSRGVSDDGIFALTSNCHNLQILNMSDTSVTGEGARNALQFLPKLKTIGGYVNMEHVSDVILSLGEELPCFTEIYDNSLIHSQNVKLLNALCPNILKLVTHIHCLPAFDEFSFPHLETLKVDCDFKDHSDTVWDFLETREKSRAFKNLVLYNQMGSGLAIEALKPVSHTLEGFEGKITYTYLPDDTVIPPFEKLQVLKLKKMECVKSSKRMMQNCPNVERLAVEHCVWPYSSILRDCPSVLDFQDVARSLRSGQFSFLQELWIESDATFGSTNCLVQFIEFTCPVLRVLGYTVHIKGIKLQELKNEIRNRNWSLDLVESPTYGKCRSWERTAS
ncbi:unnamed protein product [Cyprideis torosa]|uniref:Uncharacterized protein n=1 Tax=Cyprideis torosa TaxID=163714 RepID=A0A7R8W4G4_9CRUS|nr:unnamed protein product [Cyprideis torosa]CAG0884158.1 unnamed protein product [Cyprideis torosa]